MNARLDVMLQLARQQDPSIESKAGRVILRGCLDEIAADPDANATEIARRCLARYRTADPSWVAHLARAAVTTIPAQPLSSPRGVIG